MGLPTMFTYYNQTGNKDGRVGSSDRGGITALYDDTVGETHGYNRAADAAEAAAQERRADHMQAVQYGLGSVEYQADRSADVIKEGRAASNAAGAGLRSAIGREQNAGYDIQRAIAAAKNPEELAALESAMANQGRFLERQQQVLANIDPAVMEASRQTLAIMQGKESQFLDPIRRDRADKRKALVDNLRSQLGPGAETGTAGIQALNQFDKETSLTLSTQRQQALDQVWGIANQGAQTSSGANSQGVQATLGLTGALGAYSGRQAQAGFLGIDKSATFGGQTQGAYNNLAATRINATQNNVAQNATMRNSFQDLINTQAGLSATAGADQVGESVRAQGQGLEANKAGDTLKNFFGGMMGGKK